MELLIPTLTFEQLKQSKKNTESALKELGIELSSSTTGNLVANMFGYKNWNTAKSLTEGMSSQEKKVSDNVEMDEKNIKDFQLFNDIAGAYESQGYDEKDADKLALFSIQYGINIVLPIDLMPLNEALACLAHHWVCEVLTFLDEDKKSLKTMCFDEFMDIFELGGPDKKAMEKYLKILEVAKNDKDIFKPFLRQLGLGIKDIEVAIKRYKNSSGSK